MAATIYKAPVYKLKKTQREREREKKKKNTGASMQDL